MAQTWRVRQIPPIVPGSGWMMWTAFRGKQFGVLVDAGVAFAGCHRDVDLASNLHRRVDVLVGRGLLEPGRLELGDGVADIHRLGDTEAAVALDHDLRRRHRPSRGRLGRCRSTGAGLPSTSSARLRQTGRTSAPGSPCPSPFVRARQTTPGCEVRRTSRWRTSGATRGSGRRSGRRSDGRGPCQ